MASKRIRNATCGFVLLFAGLAPSASAVLVEDFTLSDDTGLTPLAYFNFVAVTSNGNQTGIDLGLAVSFGSAGGVNNGMFFEFANRSTDVNAGSVATSLWFETEDLLSDPHFLLGSYGDDVDFSIAPAGGGNQGFEFTINHDLDGQADNPKPYNGIESGENLLLGYTIADGVDPAALLEDLIAGGPVDYLGWTIGIHLQGTGGGGQSEKLVTTFLESPGDTDPPQDPVPEPATMLALFGLGSAMLVGRARVKRRKPEPIEPI